jgi:hypothetical protein
MARDLMARDLMARDLMARDLMARDLMARDSGCPEMSDSHTCPVITECDVNTREEWVTFTELYAWHRETSGVPGRTQCAEASITRCGSGLSGLRLHPVPTHLARAYG